MPYEDPSENALFADGYETRAKYPRVLGLICVIIALSVVSTAIYLHAFTGREVPFDYGIVIDAGSSHTQVFLYRWLGNKDSGTGLVAQEDTCSYNHGIASVTDPTVIVSCVKDVLKSVPSVLRTQTPLYLGATAGMRLLNITDPENVNLRLLVLKCALKQTLVVVKDVDVISGYDEGMYSWITVNFLADTLNPKKETHPWNMTYGALDMGGASTQFSYAVSSDIANISANATSLKLYGNVYQVISQSFLCFGVDQVFLRHQALLIKNFSSTEVIIDPCLPKGNFTTVDASLLLDSPCTSTPEYEKWLNVFDSKNKTYTFEGGSNFDECKNSIATLLNSSSCHQSGFKECCSKANIAKSSVKFMAFSSFSYVTSFFNATQASLNEVTNITAEWCKLTWDEMKQGYYKPSDRPHLTKYCFGGIYITHWLTENYGFNEKSWKNLIFQDQIEKSDIGWSLGYMINATNAIPEEKISEPSISIGVLVILVLFSIVLLIMGLIFLFKFNLLKQRFSYSRFES